MKRWSKLVSSLLPGFFMVGYVIGTGSVTTMATAGADYGMALVWTLVLSSVFTFIMVAAISKTTIVGGQTMLWSFRQNFPRIGLPVALIVASGMTLTQIASIIGVTAIMTDVVREWAGVPPMASGAVFMLLLLWLFWNGRQQLFLKALSLLVGLMGICFLITAWMAAPDPADVLRGFVPSVPSTGNPRLLIAGMVGTTLASVCLFSRSIVIQEKGWTPAELPLAYRDSLVSAILLLIINSAIMASAAGTLHASGMRIEQAIDMVRTLEPVAGRLAVTAFVVGILAAGLSSLFPNYILGAWMITDLTGKPREIHRWQYRALVAVTASFSMVVPVFGGRPVPIMIASQAVSPLIMPLIALFTWLLLLKPGYVGGARNTAWMHIGLGVTVLFTVYMLYVAVSGFLAAS